MIYWHIQMNQPWGRGKQKIDSVLMLKESIPVIGTGEWEDFQCRNFKGSGSKGLKVDDIILVREGADPIALCKVISDHFSDQDLEKKYHHNWYRKVKILSWYNDKKLFPQPQSTLQRLRNSNTDSWKFINNFYSEIIQKQSMNEIKNLLKYKKQIILQGPPGTGKTREAKLIALEMLGLADVKDLENNDQFKLIQFHPSYTYEDFVRGIVAKSNPNGKGIIYEAKNKTLGLFAKEAIENYKDSKNTTSVQSVDSLFDAFIKEISNIIDKEGKVMISKKVYIDFVDSDFFKYKSDNWESKPNGINMNFSELKKIINLSLNSREEIKNNETLNLVTREEATYFYNVIQLFNDFSQKVLNKEEKNYVLIIDEINRANLSSVLGELIYALEYRGKSVDSIYTVGESNELILPPNLYIIGTMNTADRSVGHIDYAIRRRFAFVDVLPKNLKEELADNFQEDLFMKVANLFIKNYDLNVDYNIEKNKIERSDYLSNEFDPKDVWLGHSYFIKQYVKDQNGNDNKSQPIDFNLRVEFEIKPILREYLKDGILIEGKQIDGKDIKTYIEELA